MPQQPEDRNVKQEAAYQDHLPPWLEIVATFGATLAFYVWSSCPTIGFGDTAIMVHAMRHGIINAHVNNHPFTVLMGWLLLQLNAPLSPAFQANLVSAFFGGLTVATLFGALRVAGVSRFAALGGAALAALSHSLWWHSTIVENYAISAFCVATTYLCLMKAETHPVEKISLRWLFMACATAALGIFNHVENGFLCIGVAVAGFCIVLRYPHPVQNVFRCALSALVGLSPWLLVLVHDADKMGMREALKGAFFGKFQDTFFSATPWRAISDTLFLLWFQSPAGFMTIGGAIGIWRLTRRFSLRSSVSGMVLHIAITLVVFSGYATWDRFAFLLPAFVGLSFFAGYGFSWLLSVSSGSAFGYLCAVWFGASVVLPPLFYTSLTTWALRPDSVWRARFSNQYAANLYNQAEFITNPHKRNYREVEHFANLLAEKLPPGAIFLDDDSRTYYPLADYYQNILGMRKDIQFLLVNSWGFQDWGLSASNLGNVLRQAYLRDKPFFVASIGSPYTSFFNSMRGAIPLQFERFELEQGRWIYRLKSHTEFQRERGLPPEPYSGPTILMAGHAGEINLALPSVAFSSATVTTQQDMSSFGSSWLMNDQIFVGGGNPGAELNLVLRDQSPSTERGVELTLTTAPDFGDITISVNERVVGVFSLYAPVVGRTAVSLGSITAGDTGATITMRVTGKAPQSAGYNFGIDSIQFSGAK